MKRILTMLAVMLAVRVALAYTWTDSNTGITWTYTINDGEASVGGGSYYSPAISKSTTGAVTIPSTLGRRLVTSIGNSAFSMCSELTSVTIPKGVTSIGRYAFYGCRGLTSVTIPEGVTSIGSDVFSYCSKMTSVAFEGNAPTCGLCVFEYVKSGWADWRKV